MANVKPVVFYECGDFAQVKLKESGVTGFGITRSRGFVLVFFYSNTCKYCKNFLPEYMQVPKRNPPATISLCKITSRNQNGKTIVELAKETGMKITYTPYIVLFKDGYPIVEYNADKNANAIVEFIAAMVDSTSNEPSRQINEKGEVKKISQRASSLAIYGKPKVDEVCYHKPESAYPAKGVVECSSDDPHCAYKTNSDAYN